MADKKITKEQKEQNAIVAQNMQINGAGIEIRTLQDAKLAAETFIASGLVPKQFNEPSKVLVAIVAGRELGFGLWQSLQNLHVVNGQIGIKSAAIGGLIRSSGRCKYMKQYYEGKGTDSYRAIVESKRVDDPTIHTSEFSMIDAKQAGLIGKDNWKNYPDDMLMWRALSRHGRAFYGDVLAGLYTVEELEEIHPPRETITPDAGSREERKQVDAEIKDTAAVLKEELKKVYLSFVNTAEIELGVNFELLNIGDEILWPIFCEYAQWYMEGEKDYTNQENWSIDEAKIVNQKIALEGVHKDFLDKIPVPKEEVKQE